MSEDDSIRLRHMLEAARKAVSFMQGFQRLEGNHMQAMALVKHAP